MVRRKPFCPEHYSDIHPVYYRAADDVMKRLSPLYVCDRLGGTIHFFKVTGDIYEPVASFPDA